MKSLTASVLVLSLLAGTASAASAATTADLGIEVYDRDGAIFLSKVTQSGPLAAVGRPGDQLTAIDHIPISSSQVLSSVLLHLRPGDAIIVTLETSSGKIERPVAMGLQQEMPPPHSPGIAQNSASPPTPSPVQAAPGVPAAVVDSQEHGTGAFSEAFPPFQLRDAATVPTR